MTRKSLDCMKKRALILCWLLALAHPMGAAAASVLAVDINPANGLDEETLVTNGMYGWTFGLTEPATVTGLAWYDQNPAGLSHAHEVGLWQYPGRETNGYWASTNSIPLLSLTIPAGTNATVTWQSVAGVSYFLERSADLAAPFTLLATNIVGQTNTTSYSDTNATAAGPFFYRVGVEWP
jgi:hypothetical protein